jgi:hypothetical protein
MKLRLANSEALAPVESKDMEWRIVELDPDTQRLTIAYTWLDGSDDPIKLNEYGVHYWTAEGQDFTDIFSFLIRQQDVGVKIGVGLRTLILNKFKADVLSAGNSGTFDAN